MHSQQPQQPQQSQQPEQQTNPNQCSVPQGEQPPKQPLTQQQKQHQLKQLQIQQQHQQLLHEHQQSLIREQIEAESPLIGQQFPLALLMDQFVNNQGFYIKVQALMPVYEHYRKTRRDGCCFYRALIFSVFQKIVTKGDKALQQHMVEVIKKSKEHLLQAHFQGLVFQDLQQIFLQHLQQKLPKTRQQLLSLFRNPQQSNSLVLMLRFITSGQIRNNAFLYQTFIDDQMPAQTFCQLEVEPIDKEADQIQIMALLNYLGIGIKIVYLDSNLNKEPYQVILPESCKEADIVGELLYRPGHYDILYR